MFKRKRTPCCVNGLRRYGEHFFYFLTRYSYVNDFENDSPTEFYLKHYTTRVELLN